MTARSSTACSCSGCSTSGTRSSGRGTISRSSRRECASAGVPRSAISGLVEFLQEQSALRRYVLRELKERGPLPSRELEHTEARFNERTVWWGTRAQLMWMLELLHQRGRIAVAGRDGTHRLWDLAERVYPKSELVPAVTARRARADKRFRSLGVKLERGRLLAHPDADSRPVGSRVTFLSPSTAWSTTGRAPSPSGASTTASRCTSRRRSASTATTSCRSSAATTSSGGSSRCSTARLVLRVNGVWWEPGKKEVSLHKPLRSLAAFLGADTIDA